MAASCCADVVGGLSVTKGKDARSLGTEAFTAKCGHHKSKTHTKREGRTLVEANESLSKNETFGGIFVSQGVGDGPGPISMPKPSYPAGATASAHLLCHLGLEEG